MTAVRRKSGQLTSSRRLSAVYHGSRPANVGGPTGRSRICPARRSGSACPAVAETSAWQCPRAQLPGQESLGDILGSPAHFLQNRRQPPFVADFVGALPCPRRRRPTRVPAEKRPLRWAPGTILRQVQGCRCQRDEDGGGRRQVAQMRRQGADRRPRSRFNNRQLQRQDFSRVVEAALRGDPADPGPQTPVSQRACGCRLSLPG